MTRLGALSSVAVAASIGGIVLFVQCSSVGVPEPPAGGGGVEAGPDVSGADVVASSSGAVADGGGTCTSEAKQAVTREVASWQGWETVAGLGACCAAAVPLSPATSMPAYSWVPCSNGMTGCLEFAAPWALPDAPDFGSFANASRDASGNPRWLMFSRAVGAAPYSQGATFEQDLYDISSGTPLGAWREDNTTGNHACFTRALLGQSTVTVDGEPPNGMFVASGPPQAMITGPVFQRYSSRLSGVQEEYASDSVFAFDMESAGVVARTSVASAILVRSPAGSPPLLLAMVEGQDVLAYSEAGTAGWGQLYALREDGTLPLLRSNAQAHVATPAFDGARLYWTETYGATDTTAQQTRTELWSAPYTSDPAQLAATAARFAVIANTTMPISAIAFRGLFAIGTRTAAYVARFADGMVVQPTPGPNRQFATLVAVTPSELWSIERNTNDASKLPLTRVSLGAW